MKKFSITNGLFILLFTSCSLFMAPKVEDVKVNSLAFSKQNTTIGIGGIDYVRLSINPESASKSVKITYEYDSSIISVNGDNYGATISALKNGNTMLKASVNGISTVCVVSVSGTDEVYEASPQISSSTIALEVEQGIGKRVQVALSNSIASDMTDFTWSIDKPQVAKIEGVGQSVLITGTENGIARVTVTHPKALYPYKFTVFVKPDAEKAYYVTTQQNIVTIDKNASAPEKSLSVSLVNGNELDNAAFSWSVVDSDIIKLTANAQNCIVSPLKSGEAIISISHPKSAYPLEIVIRVIAIVNNVYIDPSVIQLNINGTTPATLTAKLSGLSSYDASEFIWEAESTSLVELTPFQDSCGVSALGNGITKIKVSHPNARYPREIMVMINGHPSGSIDASMYITTTQNYIRTKVGESVTHLNISLVGGLPGDEKNFVWAVDKPDIISLSTTHGSVRSIFNTWTDGSAYITPKKEGTAIITVTHPKIIVPTEIMVTVLPASAQLTEPLYFTGQSVIGLVVGNAQQLTALLNGDNKSPADDDAISWTVDNTSVASLSAVNGNTATLTASSAGEAYITVTHPKADTPKKILVYTAASAEELAAKRVIYTSKNRYNIVAQGASETLSVYTIALAPEEIADISWTISNPSIASIAIGNTNADCIASGISAGNTTITARHPSCTTPVVFDITVLPSGTDLGIVPSPTYFTTAQNLVQFTTINTNKNVSIIPIKLAPEEYSKIHWDVEDTTVCEVIPNGSSATVTSRSEGVTKIFVSHPKAENTLNITVRVGQEYIIPPITTPYITASQDVVGLIKGQQGVSLKATLENTVSKGFVWTIDDSSIAAINPLDTSCFIVPKEAGQACVTITNRATPGIEKKVLVLVANSSEELEGIPFLSTVQNVVSLMTGTQQNVSVRIENGSAITGSTYTWNVENPSIAQVISSGKQAVVKALSEGSTRIIITNSACKYPLEIVADVKQFSSAAIEPHITTRQNIITLTEGNTASRAIDVTLAGGTELDKKDFLWSLDRSDIIGLAANTDNAIIKPLSKGECLITVTHPKSTYPLPIKVIVEPKVINTGLYIKVNPADIITMKPADPEKTISVSLIGGTAEDAYGFKWSQDNYNSIKLTSSGATAIITPIAEGDTTVKITHPKAGFPAELQIRITEYSTFAFSATNMTLTEGDTQFISMKVPAIENDYEGRVVYKTDNQKIVTITGTNKIAQLTAVGSGTTTVSATSPSGAKDEMMVYVKKSAEQTKPHITTATNVLYMKTTDSARTISAQLVGQGVLPTDQYNLQWEIEDSSIAHLIGTSGNTVYVQPLKAGETILTISHPNTATVFRVCVNIQGSASGISINKTYLSLETGKTIELSAAIDNGTSVDYQSILWSADKVNGRDICTILGSGKTVAVYGLSAGTTTISAEWNGKTAHCDVQVTASRQFTFDTQTMRIQPGQTKTFKYTLVPDDTAITWITNTNDYMSYSVDTASKTISITGIAEAPVGTAITTLTGNANSMLASISITTAWDYAFTLGKTSIMSEPRQDPSNPAKFEIPYTVNPDDALISVSVSNPIVSYVVDSKNKKIILTPLSEGSATVYATATNPKTGQIFPNMQRTCNLNFSYNKITVVPSLITKQGSFSHIDSNSGTLIIGDGEEVTIGFSVLEDNVDWTITSSDLTKVITTSKNTKLSGTVQNSLRIKNTEDCLDYLYYVKEWWSPYIAKTQVTCSEANCTLKECSGYHNGIFNTDIALNPKTDFRWEGSWGGLLNDVFSYSLSVNNFFYKKRDPSRDGTYITKNEYESTAWWWRPYHGKEVGWNDNERGPWQAQQTGYLPAELVVTLDKTVQSNMYTDKLVLIITHNNKTQRVEIPIYTETRWCVYNIQ